MGHTYNKNYLLFIRNLILSRSPVFLFAKSVNPVLRASGKVEASFQ